MKVGYIRVSTQEQNTIRQEVLMQALDVEQVFIDRMSGKNLARPELQKLLAFVRTGDCVIVESISRFARNTRDLLELIEQLQSKDIKQAVADLKKVYTAVTLEEAEANLETFAAKWRNQYPSCVKSWEENWEVLSTFFEYPQEIRKIIYTTNIIDGLNRQFRQITKNKPSFTNDDSLRRMLYLASQRIVKHWHARCQNWDLVLSQLEIMFADRRAG